jgi:pyrroloquinoline quinone biosynthesis protein B
VSGPRLLVLGVAQDGGHPQPGCRRECCTGPGVERHLTASVAITEGDRAWLIDAGPDFPRHLQRLASHGLELAGILLSHAHIGHYTGLMYLGREAMNTTRMPVWAAPGLGWFLRSNGPWRQLVAAANIDLHIVREDFDLGTTHVGTFPVPHRGEFSETIGFRISGPTATALYVPDTDGWDGWETPIESHLATADIALLDGTFFDESELPEPDRDRIPHPTVKASLLRFGGVSTAAIRFTHLNHTNPLLDPASAAAATVAAAGMAVAREGDGYEL